VLSAQDMIKAILSIDGPDIEAIVTFGANLPFARPGQGKRALARQTGPADQ
jgi:hypothetical protein